MKTLRNILTLTGNSFLKAVARITLAVCLPLAAACEFRPLEDPDEFVDVRVEINTKDINNITANIYNENVAVPDIIPEVMHVLFFEENGDRLITEKYISARETDAEGDVIISGIVRIHPGKYRMMVYNFDTKSTSISNYNQWSLMQASTGHVADHIASKYYACRAELSKADSQKSADSRSDGSLAAMPEQEIIAYEPDHLLVASEPELVIPYREGVYTIRTEARSIIDTYYMQIKVDGLKYVESAQAFLSGMASGNVLSENRRITSPSHTLYFTLNPGDDKGTAVICNIFHTFGHIYENTNSLDVTFAIRTKDGRSVQHTFDMTDVFRKPEAVSNHWLLIDETVRIEPPTSMDAGTGGGMDPSVDDWANENHDIFI